MPPLPDGVATAERLTTIGVWAFCHPEATAPHYDAMLEAVLGALHQTLGHSGHCGSNTAALLRGRAAFALANIAAALAARAADSPGAATVRRAAAIATASLALLTGSVFDPLAATHGCRALGFVLAALPEEDLIFELPDCEGGDDGVAAAALGGLTRQLSSCTDARVRTAAARALADALRRADVCSADPPAARAATRALLAAVRTDASFRVRAFAAEALSASGRQTFAMAGRAALLDGLVAGLRGSGETDTFGQFRDLELLRTKLRAALVVLVHSIAGARDEGAAAADGEALADAAAVERHAPYLRDMGVMSRPIGAQQMPPPSPSLGSSWAGTGATPPPLP